MKIWYLIFSINFLVVAGVFYALSLVVLNLFLNQVTTLPYAPLTNYSALTILAGLLGLYIATKLLPISKHYWKEAMRE